MENRTIILTQEEKDNLFAILVNAYSIKHPMAVATTLATNDIRLGGFVVQ